MTADIAVEIRTLEPTTTIAVRLETRAGRLSEVFDRDLPRVGAVLSDVGGQTAGPPFARYHHYGPDRVDVEVGAPIAFVTAGLQPVSGKPDGIIGVSSLPGGLAAVTIDSGPYDTLSQTYDVLERHATVATDGERP